MTPGQRLVHSYDEGRITLDGLFLGLLSLGTTEDVRAALELLTPELVAQLRDFVASHRPRAMIFNGPRPTPENVRFVAEWYRRPVQDADRYKPAGT